MLSEHVLMGQLPRLLFPNGGRGVLQMSGPGVIAEQTLIVNTTVSCAVLHGRPVSQLYLPMYIAVNCRKVNMWQFN